MGGAMSKRKGANYERKIAKLLSDAFDTKVSRIPCSGALPGWAGDLRDLTGVLKDFVWELKCQEKLNIWSALSQAEREALGSTRMPVVVFTRNNAKNYVALELNDFLSILAERKTDECNNSKT